jgi:hypothetical protein
VALESVCYDVLFQEYVEDGTKKNYPIQFKAEIADYLSQCASSDFWPAGFTYDPEGDGTPIGSLGVFEHWNNATDRQYSRNLGTGDGIELKYFIPGVTGISSNSLKNINIASPNPFSNFTKFKKPAEVSKNSKLEIYNMKGELIRNFDFADTDVIVWNGSDNNNRMVSNGLYIFRIYDNKNQTGFTGKVIFKK